LNLNKKFQNWNVNFQIQITIFTIEMSIFRPTNSFLNGNINFENPTFYYVIMALPFKWKNILKQKKNYGNSNILQCKNIIFKKTNPLKETKLLQDITTLSLIPSFYTSQNIIFQKSSHKNRPTTCGSKIH